MQINNKTAEIKIEDLDTSVLSNTQATRLLNCLQRLKIKTIGELLLCPKSELRYERNFGNLTYSNLQKVLGTIDLVHGVDSVEADYLQMITRQKWRKELVTREILTEEDRDMDEDRRNRGAWQSLSADALHLELEMREIKYVLADILQSLEKTAEERMLAYITKPTDMKEVMDQSFGHRILKE